jgi:hypothetical protein
MSCDLWTREALVLTAVPNNSIMNLRIPWPTLKLSDVASALSRRKHYVYGGSTHKGGVYVIFKRALRNNGTLGVAETFLTVPSHYSTILDYLCYTCMFLRHAWKALLKRPKKTPGYEEVLYIFVMELQYHLNALDLVVEEVQGTQSDGGVPPQTIATLEEWMVRQKLGLESPDPGPLSEAEKNGEFLKGILSDATHFGE